MKTINPKLLMVAVLGLAACDPYLFQQSVAPPGRSARLDEVNGFWGQIKRYRLEVSEGVALALTCNHGGPCEKMTVTSENTAVAEVRPASLAALQTTGYGTMAQQQPAAAFVVIGKAPGTTRVHVKAKGGSRDVVVTVIAPPSSGLLVDENKRAKNDANQDREREGSFDGSQHVAAEEQASGPR